mgnify:CR=1 FL=1
MLSMIVVLIHDKTYTRRNFAKCTTYHWVSFDRSFCGWSNHIRVTLAKAIASSFFLEVWPYLAQNCWRLRFLCSFCYATKSVSLIDSDPCILNNPIEIERFRSNCAADLTRSQYGGGLNLLTQTSSGCVSDQLKLTSLYLHTTLI